MKWVGLIAALLAAVLACSSPVWQRVDGYPVSPNEFARDDAICGYPLGGGYSSGIIGAIWRAQDKKLAHDSCMAEHGWIVVPVQPPQLPAPLP
jgi:hypothetical protein